MADSTTEKINQLKKHLRIQVSRFCSENKASWKYPILQTLYEIRSKNWPAVIFGGTVRSLMLGTGTHRRPRDIDIVLSSVSVDNIKELFSDSFVRKTRFGGVKLQRNDMDFDIWPIDKTWAYVNDDSKARTYGNLPKTTFLNIEAIAIDIWPKAEGQKRTIYSDDDSFFKAIISETLEINREENPFPNLCVVRSLIMAAKTRFKLGPRLSEYIEKYGFAISPQELEEVQIKHYGKVKVQGNTLLEWIDYIKNERKINQPISLPISYKQLKLWRDIDQQLNPKVHLYYD
ncbi:MAG: hypothetical protein V2B20_11655 [Pseudomonadota bacterium]